MPQVSVEILFSFHGWTSCATVVVEASREALLIAAAREFKLEPKDLERACLFCIDLSGHPIELADAGLLSNGDTIVLTLGESPVPHSRSKDTAQKATYWNADEVSYAFDPPTPPVEPMASASDVIDPWDLMDPILDLPTIGLVLQPYEKRIFFLRHGEGEHNATHNSALPDPLLTELGRRQAESWAVEMPQIAQPEVVLFSPLTRTLQTGLYAFQHCSARFEVCQHAREYPFWDRCNKPTDDLTVLRRLLDDSLPRGHEILALDGTKSHTGIRGTGGLQEGITELEETAWDSTLHGAADTRRFYADADRVHKASFDLLTRELCQREETTIAVSTHSGVMSALLNVNPKNCELVEAVLDTQTGQLTKIESYECPLSSR